MLDIKLIRGNPEFVKTELARTGSDPTEIDRLLECDLMRRSLQHLLDDLCSWRIGSYRKDGGCHDLFHPRGIEEPLPRLR